MKRTIFKDFQGLESNEVKFNDFQGFQGPVRTLYSKQKLVSKCPDINARLVQMEAQNFLPCKLILNEQYTFMSYAIAQMLFCLRPTTSTFQYLNTSVSYKVNTDRKSTSGNGWFEMILLFWLVLHALKKQEGRWVIMEEILIGCILF